MSVSFSAQKLIALNRFGLGANSQHANWLPTPKQNLIAQLDNQKLLSSLQGLPNSKQLAQNWLEYKSDRTKVKKAKKQQAQTSNNKQPKKALNKGNKNLKPQKIAALFASTVLKQQIAAEHSVNWRLLDFFTNHFSVSANNGLMAYLAGSLSVEAIAANLYGRFEDMLLAVSQHPAMLLYLNNEKSFGPNSPVVNKRKKFGLNENLAREILELHTLGINGGYNQTDVTELAKAITGWSLTNPSKDQDIKYQYRHRGHEPGKRTVLGKVYPAGKNQGQQILTDLARHPSTARFVATKLARHFIADVPPTKLVDQLTTTWLKTNGDIKAVMTSLINSDLAWQPEQRKFKTPNEFVVSTLRLLNYQNANDKQLLSWVTKLGQKPLSAGSPAGYPDTEADWNSANALMARIDWVNMLSSRVRGQLDNFIPLVFGSDKTSDNYLQIVRAESRREALALLLLSPEFMRR